jgi:hypothetical protein
VIRGAALLLLLGGSLAAGAPEALSGTASAQPLPAAAPASVTEPAEALGHAGVIYMFSFSQWHLHNGRPLGYTPFELGYDFGKGVRVQTGVDIFYYTGPDVEDGHPELGRRDYSYECTDWRTSVAFRMDTGTRLRPLAALSLNLVGGSKRLAPDFSGPAGKDLNANSPKSSAWNYVGLGSELALEYLLSPDWTLHLGCRYDMTFNSVPSPIVPSLGLMVGF